MSNRVPKKKETLSDEPFSYRAFKDDRVQLLYRGHVVETLAATEGRRFLAKVDTASPRVAQRLMAKATRNFKRGNERLAKSKRP
jgi:hypothetical protein